MKLLAPAVAALVLHSAAAAAAGGFEAPESAVQDPSTRSIYVSNVAGSPGERDGNGFISRLDPDGTVKDVKFLPAAGQPKLNAPKGLAITKTTLWVTDIDRVVGYDLRTRKQIAVHNFARQGAKFLNDLAVLPDGRLLVSDTATDTVWAIAANKKAAAPELILRGATGGANGLYVDPATQALFVVSSPIDFQTKAHAHRFDAPAGKPFRIPTTVTAEGGIYDGVALIGGALYVSDWTRGAVLRLDSAGRATAVVTGLKGPTDFGVTTDGKQLIVVDLGASTVALHDLPAATSAR